MWFEVVTDRFDWITRNGRDMKLYLPGQPYFGTRECVEYGLSIGAIRKIGKPKGWKVNKSGEAVPG